MSLSPVLPLCSDSGTSTISFHRNLEERYTPRDFCNRARLTSASHPVIPDVAWSDHPQDKWGTTDFGNVYGPAWVGDIIDAVGGGMANSACNGIGSGKYWTQDPTLIIVVWDDWGGWFDHVAPIAALQQNPHQGYTQCDPNSQWGCGYTSGFRVPLLVVSPYTGTYKNGTYSGYVSGACGASPLPACPNKVPPYLHDFGSILRFTEYNFSMPRSTRTLTTTPTLTLPICSHRATFRCRISSRCRSISRGLSCRFRPRSLTHASSTSAHAPVRRTCLPAQMTTTRRTNNIGVDRPMRCRPAGRSECSKPWYSDGQRATDSAAL
jgi:hypothetical protein